MNTRAEAVALASLAKTVTGATVDAAALDSLMAAEGRVPEDVFVEETARHLLYLIALPIPPDLAEET